MGFTVKNNLPRYGTFLHTDDGLNIGIEMEIDEMRPFVIAHPAAGNHYHASLSFAQEINHPFIQVVVDIYPYYPDTWPSEITNCGNLLKYQRLNDTLTGDPVFRVCDQKQPHWQVQVAKDANIYLSTIPKVDILYLDWLDWVDYDNNITNKQFHTLIDSVAKYVKNGGLIILDHKHELTSLLSNGYVDDYFSIDSVKSSSNVNYSGEIEWLGENSSSEFTAYNASVFVVQCGRNENKSDMREYQKWFSDLIPEFALTENQIKQLLKNNQNQYSHVDAFTWADWNQNYIASLKNDVHYVTSSQLIPAFEAWDLSYYQKFLTWLLENNHLLSKKVSGRTYQYSQGSHRVSIFHGDIVELAPMFYHENSVIAVRNSLSKRIINRCPWWKDKIIKMQASKAWGINPIRELKWSGEHTSDKLIKEMMELGHKKFVKQCKQEGKSNNCVNILTIANGTGELNELLDSFELYLTSFHKNEFDIMNLFVFHIDDFDYQEKGYSSSWERVNQDI